MSNVSYTDPTPNNFPSDYDSSQVDSRIKLRSKSIQHKKYGKYTREALYQGLEIGGVIANEAKSIANSSSALAQKTKKELDAGVSALTKDSEVVIARGNEATLGNRLNKQDEVVANLTQGIDISAQKSIKQYTVSKFNEVGGKIQSYFSQALNVLSEKIDDSFFNIGFITDNHYQMSSYAPGSLSHYMNIAAISRMNRLQAIIAGGDNINGYYDIDEISTESKHITTALFNRTNSDTDVFFVMGNHDSGEGDNGKITPDKILDLDNMKELYETNNLLYNEVRNNGSLYGFKDYTNFKIRVIWLNSFDLPYTLNSDGTYKYNFLTTNGYQNNQLNWLANTALKLPESNWQVMIFTHAPIPGGFDVAAGQAKIIQYNSDVLVSILNAFQSGVSYSIDDSNREFAVSVSCDFSSQGISTIIGFISGHIHQDGQMIYKGINCIETAASLCYSGDSNRKKGTLTEDCWDVYSVNPSSKKLNIYRFGYGSDRTVIYKSGIMNDTAASISGNSLAD